MNIEISNKRIIISEQVKKILCSYRQVAAKSKEAGGILLGQVSSKEIYVSKATVPSKMDKRLPFNFERSPKSADLIPQYEHLNSDGFNTYIGEWHSHPEDNATPSSQDRKMIYQQYHENTILVKELVMVILGRKSDFIGLFDGKVLHEERCFLDYTQSEL